MAVDYHSQNGLNAYKTYVALRLHFTKDNYDYFRFGGSTNASLESYQKRKDAIFFEMIGKHPDPVNFIAFSFASFDKVFAKELATNQKFKQNYEQMKAQLDSVSYQLKQISDASYFATIGGKHPHIITDYLSNKISLILLCAADAALDLTKIYDQQIKDPIVWPKISTKIKKLKPFLALDGNKLREAFISRWNSNLDT